MQGSRQARAAAPPRPRCRPSSARLTGPSRRRRPSPVILLFTDYGWRGPYTGQVRLVLAAGAPGVPVIELMADAPAFSPRAAAHLLAALVAEGHLPAAAIVVAVVDPGVGGARAGIAVDIDGRWFLGPDNGLFEFVCRRAARPPVWTRLPPPPPGSAATFHGRDVFAPAAARLARGRPPPGEAIGEGSRFPDWPDDWPAVIHVDSFGNCVTGVRAATLPPTATALVGGRRLGRARTFGDVGWGEPFCYANSLGLLEIAVNGGRADQRLGLTLGTEIAITSL